MRTSIRPAIRDTLVAMRRESEHPDVDNVKKRVRREHPAELEAYRDYLFERGFDDVVKDELRETLKRDPSRDNHQPALPGMEEPAAIAIRIPSGLPNVSDTFRYIWWEAATWPELLAHRELMADSIRYDQDRLADYDLKMALLEPFMSANPTMTVRQAKESLLVNEHP